MGFNDEQILCHINIYKGNVDRHQWETHDVYAIFNPHNGKAICYQWISVLNVQGYEAKVKLGYAA